MRRPATPQRARQPPPCRSSRPLSQRIRVSGNEMPGQIKFGYTRVGAGRLSRRDALGRLLAAAGMAAFGAGGGTGRAQDVKAPVGDSAQLVDLGMELNPEQRAAGVAFLKRHASIDTHCHPGRFFLSHLPYQTPTTKSFGAPFPEQAIADLNAGQVSAALFAAVADMRLIEANPQGGLHAGREFQPGEAYADYRRQLDELKMLVKNHELARGLSPADVYAAQHRHQTA